MGRFWVTSPNILEFVIHHIRNTYDVVARSIRSIRKWYQAHVRGWAKDWKWKWQKQGFMAYDRATFFAQLKTIGT